LRTMKIQLGQSYPQAIAAIPSLEKAYWASNKIANNRFILKLHYPLNSLQKNSLAKTRSRKERNA
jgi:hypothetical protein